MPRIEVVYPGILGKAGKGFTNNFWPFLLIIIGLMFVAGVATNRKKKVSFKRDVVDARTATTGEGGWIISDVVFGGYSDKRANIVVDDKSDSRLVLQGALIFSGCTVQ